MGCIDQNSPSYSPGASMQGTCSTPSNSSGNFYNGVYQGHYGSGIGWGPSGRYDCGNWHINSSGGYDYYSYVHCGTDWSY